MAVAARLEEAVAVVDPSAVHEDPVAEVVLVAAVAVHSEEVVEAVLGVVAVLIIDREQVLFL